MSIFTHTFPLYVRQQLEDRSNILISGNDINTKGRIQGTTKYPAGAFYTNTVERQCVIRMCSGVDLNKIGEKEILANKKERDNWRRENLARNWILEGGMPISKETQDGLGKVIPRGGFNASLHQGIANQGFSSYGDPMTRSDAKDGYGIVPMPGIIDAQIKVKSAYGSLREGKVNFVCHNRRQLEILELLYMRPGYPILLEYGWTPHIKTSMKTKNISKSNDFFIMNEFFSAQSSMPELNDAILKKKQEAGGNYDAHLGVCKNFEIKAREDGGYDCSTTIISMGEILEGLKGRRDYPAIQAKEDDDAIVYDNFEVYLIALQQKMRATAAFEKHQNRTLMGRAWQNLGGLFGMPFGYTYLARQAANPFMHNISPEFSLAYQSIFAKGTGIKIFGQEEAEAENTEGQSSTLELGWWEVSWLRRFVAPRLLTNFDALYKNSVLKVKVAKIDLMDSFLLHKGERLGFDKDGNATLGKSQYEYIRWDFLSELLNKFILNNATADEDEAKDKPLVRISYANETEESPDDNGVYLNYSNYTFQPPCNVPINYSSTHANSSVTGSSGVVENSKGEISVSMSDIMDGSMNPAICLFPHQIDPTDSTYKPEGTLVIGKEKFAKQKKVMAFNRAIGLVYINVQYLLDTYRNMRYDSEGGDNEDFSMLKYIKKVWEDDITGACAGTHEFIFQMPNNVGRVIDTSYQGGLKAKDLYEFKIQSNESIVRDFNFNTTLDKKLSATISIAAQGTKNVSSLDQLSFAAFNKNISNRFVKETIDPTKAKENRINLEKDVIALASQLFNYKLEMITEGSNEEENDKSGQSINVSNAIKKAQLLEKKILQLGMTYPVYCGAKEVYVGVDEEGEVKECKPGGLHPAAGQRKAGATVSKSSIIPLKFNALLDGIGGIVIGNVFRVEKNKLPKGYQGDDIAFVVFGVNHKISNGQDWVTEISGQLILLDTQDEDVALQTYGLNEITSHLNGGKVFGKVRAARINADSGLPEYVRFPNTAKVVKYVDNKYDDAHLSKFFIQPGGDLLDGFVSEKTAATSIDDPFPQLDSGGGDLTTKMADILIYVLNKIKKETDDPPGMGAWQEWTGEKNRFNDRPRRSKTNPYHIRLTGGLDKYHVDEKPNSYHNTGNAVDFAISPSAPENIEEIERILMKIVIGSQVNSTALPGTGTDTGSPAFFRYQNEYPGGKSANPGNPHFHIVYDPTGTDKAAGGHKELKLARELHEKGELYAGSLHGDGPGVFKISGLETGFTGGDALELGHT